MSDVKLTTVTVDGLSVQTTDAGAQAISKLNTELADARKAQKDAEGVHAAQIAAKDQELAAKDAQIDDLKAKVFTDQDLDEKVRARADLIAKAKSVADQDYTGQNEDEIRTSAVVARLGKDAIAGKPAAYIAARFDILTEDAGQDPVRKVLRAGDVKNAVNTVEQAHDGMVNHLQNAWMGEEKR